MEVFEIKPRLFQSTAIDDPLEVWNFNLVVDLEGGFDRFFPMTPTYLYWHIFDIPVVPDTEQLWNVARFAFNAWKGGMKVLVHCTQGKNRSGLVNGCILWLDGMKGEDAVALIRMKRPGALFNPVFVKYLEELGERPR